MKAKDIISYTLLLIFSAFLIAGINLNEYLAILEKAVKICLSCVGIG
jgi:hypothetical protein